MGNTLPTRIGRVAGELRRAGHVTHLMGSGSAGSGEPGPGSHKHVIQVRPVGGN
jgi:hypothetical protein